MSAFKTITCVLCKLSVLLGSVCDAGQTDKHRDSETLFLLYKVLLLVWIVFGLGYLVMILGFITRAMRSKRMARLERKLASNIKQTQSKIWSSFTRDVSYLRRILNEMYVMTLKVPSSLADTLKFLRKWRERGLLQ
jgi:hypothetical protein